MQVLNEALLSALIGWRGLQARLADEEGQTLAEYGLIVGVISVAVVVVALVAFRDVISNAFAPIAQCINGNGNCNGQFP